jgi:DNA replication protein DnaC
MMKRMTPRATTQQTTMNNLKPERKLLKSEKVSCSGADYIWNTYDIEHYGEALYVQEAGRTDGDFRKVRAMIPFEFIGMKPKDFIWSKYGCDVEAQKKIANAFIINFEKFEANGKGLYIFSKKKGSGKTMLASCLLNELIDSKPINAKFITALDFIELTKKGFR